MARRSLERSFRRVAMASLALALSAVTGAGVARWAISDINGFYMTPIDRYGSQAYARQQPVADSFWQAQDGSDAEAPGFQAVATSTATSAQPAYRSASGS